MKNINQPEDKFELRAYLESLRLEGLDLNRATEIVSHIRRVMAPYLKYPEDDELRQYYEPVLKNIEKKFEQRDFSPGGLVSVIDDLVGYIQWQ